MVVGGDWNGEHYEIRQHSDSAEVDGAGLVLAGDNNASAGLRVFNGDAIYGGTKGTLDVQGGGVAISQSVDMSANAQAAATALDYFRNLSGTPIDTSDMNNIKPDINSAPEQNGYHIFTLNTSEVTGNRTLDFQNSTPDDVIVINLIGTNLDWSWSSNFNPRQLLWTFDGATIQINSVEFVGSLLAPGAAVHQEKNLNGTMVANSLTIVGSPELHNFTFLAPIGSIPIPESGSALLAMMGVTVLLLGRRQRR